MIALTGEELREYSRELREKSKALSHRTALLLRSSDSLLGSNGIIKTCSCGKVYRFSDWNRANYIGWQQTGKNGGELRNCSCSSTMLLILSPRYGT